MDWLIGEWVPGRDIKKERRNTVGWGNTKWMNESINSLNMSHFTLSQSYEKLLFFHARNWTRTRDKELWNIQRDRLLSVTQSLPSNTQYRPPFTVHTLAKRSDWLQHRAYRQALFLTSTRETLNKDTCNSLTSVCMEYSPGRHKYMCQACTHPSTPTHTLFTSSNRLWS